MKLHRRLRFCHVFTLVEVLIAAMIMILAVVPISYVFSTTVQETERDRQELIATALASEVLEQVRAMAVGQIGVRGMQKLPEDNPFPEFPNWLDLEQEQGRKGNGFPLMNHSEIHTESSRLYLQPGSRGFHRYLQVMRAPLSLKGAYSRSPDLLEIRVRVDYGADPEDPKTRRQVILDTLVSHEDV